MFWCSVERDNNITSDRGSIARFRKALICHTSTHGMKVEAPLTKWVSSHRWFISSTCTEATISLVTSGPRPFDPSRCFLLPPPLMVTHVSCLPSPLISFSRSTAPRHRKLHLVLEAEGGRAVSTAHSNITPAISARDNGAATELMGMNRMKVYSSIINHIYHPAMM